jgi:anti-sigma regulatory factor (Ser/Thr protein kinase)
MSEPSKPTRSPERAARSFRNDDVELRPLSDWFRGFARENGVARARTLDFELCLNELVTNIIHYAYADRGRHEIRVALEWNGDELRATVEDDGWPFDPLEKEPPAIPSSLEDAGVGGWGISIIRALADDLSYERHDGRNRFTIISREGRSENQR